MRNPALAILVFILVSRALASQQPLAPQAQVDTLIARSRGAMNQQVDLADSLAHAALTLAQEHHYARGEAHAYAQIGLASFYRSDNKEAVKAYLQALKIYEQSQLDNDLIYTLVMVRLAAIFHAEHDWPQTHYYNQKALKAAQASGDAHLLGLAYGQIADTHTGLQHYDSAFYFYEAAIKAFTSSGEPINVANMYNNIGINYFFMGRYDRAIAYYKKGLTLNRHTGQHMVENHAYYNIGEAYYYLKQYSQTLVYMDSAYAAAGAVGEYDGVPDIYLLKARVFRELKNGDSSAFYFEKLIAFKDSVYSDTYKKERAAMQATLDVYKHESENNLLKKDNRIANLYRNLAIAGAVALIFILAFVLTRQRLRIQRGIKARLEEEVRQRTAEIEEINLKLQLSLHRAKVDPHFIFNVLNAVQHIVLEKKPHEALDHLGKLSRLMRYVLEKSSLEIVTVQEEINMLEQYIQLEQLRLDDKFQYQIEAHLHEPVPVPAMLIQPYVENAILHGLSPAAGAGLLLKLLVEKTGEFLRIVVEDNGVGRKPGARDGHRSMGSMLGQKRLDILSRLEHKLFSLTIEDLVRNDQPTGTRVILQIPLTTT